MATLSLKNIIANEFPKLAMALRLSAAELTQSNTLHFFKT